jgi:hypothetical protein
LQLKKDYNDYLFLKNLSGAGVKSNGGIQLQISKWDEFEVQPSLSLEMFINVFFIFPLENKPKKKSEAIPK